MPDKKISQLPQAVINSTSIFPIVTGGITSRVSFDEMSNAFGGGGSQNLDQVLGVGNTSNTPIILNESYSGGGDSELYSNTMTGVGFEVRLAADYGGDPYNVVNYFEAGGVSTRQFKIDGEFSEGDTQGGWATDGGKYNFSEVFLTESNFPQQKGNGLDFKCYGNPSGNYGGTFRFPFKGSLQNLYTLAVTDDLPRVFKGIFNQSGIDEPVVQEFHNNTSFTAYTFTRSSFGVYVLSIPGNYIAYINVGQNVLDVDSLVHAYTSYEAKSNETLFYIYTYSGGILSDDVVTNMYLEIGLKEII